MRSAVQALAGVATTSAAWTFFRVRADRSSIPCHHLPKDTLNLAQRVAHPATRLSAFTLLTPVFGLLMGVLLLDEPITARLLLALAGVALGMTLVNRSPRQLRMRLTSDVVE